MPETSFTFGSLFSGIIGGFDLGFERAGMRCVWQCEINEQARDVLASHWDGVPCFKDVTTLHATDAVRPDIICGGFPCQDLSVAGRRAGLAGERSGLFYEFMRIVSEFAPTWVCIENVPGLLSSNEGRDMGAVVGTLADLGYGWAYRVLDAQYFGLAQRRRRVFIVGCLGDFRRASEVLFERESLPWDSPPSRETGARVAHCISGGAHPGGHNGQDDMNVIAATLNSGGNSGGFRTEPGEHIIPIDMRQASRGAKMTNNRTDGGAPGTGIGRDGDPASTICDSHVPAVAFAQNQRDELREMDIAGALAAEPGMKQQTYANTAMGVRRLMPIECERLQGFPDNWTHGSDSARYRMLGNAVAVPVAEWIGNRIMEATP